MPRNERSSSARSGRSSSSGSSRSSNRSDRNEWSNGVMDMARERPIAAAAVAAGAAAAGLFLWSKRSQISNQLSNISDQIGEWAENRGSDMLGSSDDTGGLTTTGTATGSRSTGRGKSSPRGMSLTGGGNASLGRTSGGAGTMSSASGRGRAQATAPTQQ